MLALNPNCVEALNARGHLLMRMGRDAEAVELFTALVKRDEHALDTLLALSSVPRLVDFDLLSELDKVFGADRENTAQSEDASFIWAAALDTAGRHAEAWECLTAINRAILTAVRERFDTEANRQQVSLEDFGTIQSYLRPPTFPPIRSFCFSFLGHRDQARQLLKNSQVHCRTSAGATRGSA